MMISHPPRVTRAVTRTKPSAPLLESDQLLLLTVAVLLWQEGASLLLILALVYVAM